MNLGSCGICDLPQVICNYVSYELWAPAIHGLTSGDSNETNMY